LDESDIRSLMQAAGAQQGRSQADGDVAVRERVAADRRGGRGARIGAGPRQGGPSGRAPQGARSVGQRQDRGEDRQVGGQPDPMKTSLGYIGADSFTRQRQDGPNRNRSANSGSRRGGRNR
jgi:23S rRNA pseudouridine2605 synthase